ncbi:MarR family winged helix-turn-helix transcriptional regulator [Devosia sp.]|uniref:MarR family winged helix-turn-helix transcriptional regulator n=1 Tax=Devosia sp. TaxID=1871048 RepID=UPI003263BC6A
MRAIVAGAGNASELARRLSVTKQAAAKTIAVLQERGYVGRTEDAHDARRKLLQVTPLGYKMLAEGEAVFEELRTQWERQIGVDELARLEASLVALVGAAPIKFDAPGQIAPGLDEGSA